VDIHVTTAGFTKNVTSSFGVEVKVDRVMADVDVNNYDALAVPGGFAEFGFYEEAYSEPFLQLLRDFDASGKPIASVCVGALPLGKSGVLSGRRGTTYHLRDGYRQKELAAFGVNVVNEPVVVDGNVITSYCPQTAATAGFELLAKVTSPETAATVKAAMGY
jgi:4-methyl-5(b-hydroxyethyl)-thiazole monophosphate biosynthesis